MSKFSLRDHYVALRASHDDGGCAWRASHDESGVRKICLPRAKRRNSYELLRPIGNSDEAPDHYVALRAPHDDRMCG